MKSQNFDDRIADAERRNDTETAAILREEKGHAEEMESWNRTLGRS